MERRLGARSARSSTWREFANRPARPRNWESGHDDAAQLRGARRRINSCTTSRSPAAPPSRNHGRHVLCALRTIPSRCGPGRRLSRRRCTALRKLGASGRGGEQAGRRRQHRHRSGRPFHPRRVDACAVSHGCPAGSRRTTRRRRVCPAPFDLLRAGQARGTCRDDRSWQHRNCRRSRSCLPGFDVAPWWGCFRPSRLRLPSSQDFTPIRLPSLRNQRSKEG